MEFDTTIYYKITDIEGKTHGDTVWAEGIEHKAIGTGIQFCSPDLIHFYTHPLLAMMHNPGHRDYQPPRLWEIIASLPVYHEGQLKSGAKLVRVIKEISLPNVSVEQRIRYGILCAKKVYSDENWVTWAENWLTNKNRDVEVAKTIATNVFDIGNSIHRGSYYSKAAHAYAAAYATVATCENDTIIGINIGTYVSMAVQSASDASDHKIDLISLVFETMK